ncbi:hypothetical protein LTR36_008855 [Oleoguttula mirabilis]|uniref:BTB domain-containing protein n=1 Tax=Oleoguttula mirabilis TaxID=1507867 RepID=A0AAV9J6Y0_9PEZI|nr:hypothetical protein LTR36_008855 [Oleoguttula mirabilis]
MATTGFPRCSDGDVKIHLSSDPKDTFVLHSFQLSLHSSWFKASMSERWNGGDFTNTSVFGGRDGEKEHWEYELRFEKGTGDGMLMRKRASTDMEMMVGQDELIDMRVECLTAYKHLLGAVYHVKPRLPHGSFEKAKSSILQLASVAAIYDCGNIIEPHIDNHLSAHWRDQALSMCAEDPVSMLSFATSIKSEWIFMEAATNLVGTSSAIFDAAQAELQKLHVADLFNKKRAEFVETLRKCEYDMFCMQSEFRGEPFAHEATDFFCQYLRDSLGMQGLGSRLAHPEYARLYKTINASAIDNGNSYSRDLMHYIAVLGIDPVPITDVVMSRFAYVLQRARVILQPILKDASRRRNAQQSQDHGLLFMTVADEELPWVNK